MLMAGVLVAGVLLAGVMSGAAAVADSQRTYLDLSHETVRQQLAADDLQAAARTLSWIRRVDATPQSGLDSSGDVLETMSGTC